MMPEDMSTADREAREKSLDEMYFGQGHVKGAAVEDYAEELALGGCGAGI
jgi:hypothetical protein